MRVLLIDDNQEITDAVSFYLETIDISCKVVNEGKGALDAIINEEYQLALVDLTMPEYSGYDILDKLKNDGLLKSKNIIIFTAANLSAKDIEGFLALGAKGVLKKPVSIQQLSEVIEPFRNR